MTRRILCVTLIFSFLLVVAFSLCAALTFATEYYVDSLSGADASDGRSPATAWRTLARVNEAELDPGDVVRFRAGRVWRGSLRARSGAPGASVRYERYGEGAPPRVMSSADLSASSLWSRVGSEPIWSTPADSYVELAASESVSSELSTFGRGSWFVYCEESARARCESRRFEELDGASGYSVFCDNSSDKPTHLQLTTQGFPVRANRYVALRLRMRASTSITLDTSVPKLMKTSKPWTSYGATLTAPTALDSEWREYDLIFQTKETAEDGRITFFLGSKLPAGTRLDFVVESAREVKWRSLGLGADVGNLVLTDREVVARAANDAVKEFAPTYDKRERAGFKKWTRDELRQEGDFWYDTESHRVYLYCTENPGDRYGSIEAPLRDSCCVCVGNDIVIDGLAFTHTGAHGISIREGERVVIRNCVFDWIGGGDLYGGGGSGRRVRFGNGVEFWDGSVDCLVERCRFSRIYDVATTTQGPNVDVSRNLVIRDNVMFRCEQAFEIWFNSPETVVEGLVFERNLCVDCGYEWSHEQRPNKIATPILGYQLEAKTVDITICNNVFCDTAQYFIKCWHNRIGEYKVDHNVYWTRRDPASSSSRTFFAFNAMRDKRELTYDEYRSTTGHDAHSRWLEPKFKDVDKDEFELLNREELDAGPKLD